MTSNLFRPEVLEAKRNESLGTVRIASPPSRWIITGFIVLIAISAIAFISLGHYTRRERVEGVLVPNAGLLTLNAFAIGTVTRLHVHEGQTVQKGDPLIEISSELDSLMLGSTHAAISEQLRLQRARLEADLTGQTQLTAQEDKGLQDRLAMLRAQLNQIDAQLTIQRQLAQSAQKLLEKIKPLSEKGYVSIIQIEQQKTAALDAQTQLNALNRQHLDTEQQLSQLQQQLAQLPLTSTARRNDIQRQLSDIDKSLAENEVSRSTLLRAPHAGIVTSSLIKEAQTVTAGQPLITILPAGSSLQAQLLVPSRAIGFIQPGAQVVLRYQAYPYQKFGQQSGRMLEISRSALSPAQVNNLTGQTVQEPLYQALVTLDRQTIPAYERNEALKPGMALEADILLDRRRLIEWIFEPLYGLASKARLNTDVPTHAMPTEPRQ